MTPEVQLPIEIDEVEVDRELTALGELVLQRYRASTGEVGYQILLDGSFLMASHGCHSEQAMAGLAHARLARPAHDLSVLVGGLGAGHTLRAALDLPGVSRVVVAEIGAKVVEWNRRFFGEVNHGAVDDPRVEIRLGDVAEVLAAAKRGFDLVLLDVDNGPGWLAAPGNSGLYDETGLARCRAALRPGGVLAVWSPRPNPVFVHSLAAVFNASEAVDTGAASAADGEPGSTIYLAVREP